jgi:peptide/nickel transport system permease protein
MQRYIARRVLQSFLAIWVMSLIVFCLARLSGNALDVMLPMESTQEDYDRLAKYWGLDQPVHVQYGIFVAGDSRATSACLGSGPGTRRWGS